MRDVPWSDTVWSQEETLPLHETQKRDADLWLDRQITYVLRNSHFYQRKFKQLRTDRPWTLERLADTPFTEKSELLADQLEYPPFGSNLCIPISQAQRIHKTSGTTGRPLLLAYTYEDIQHTHRAGARCFWAAGLRPEHLIVHCLNYCMWAGGLTDHLSLEATGAAVVPFGVGNSRSLLEFIRILGVNAIHCTPSYMKRLELLLQETGASPKELHLKLGLFGAESGLEDPGYRTSLEETWGLRAVNANYGMSDVLATFGAECLQRDGLHFMGQGIVHLEIIAPESGESLPFEQGVRGELVFTHLRKEAQPLIRYRSRDVVEVLGTECSCGRKGLRFAVRGRSDDMLVVKGVNVFPGAVAVVINAHPGFLTGEYQIVVNKTPPIQRMVIRAETRENHAVSEEELRVLSRELSEKLALKPEIEFVPYGGLPRTDSKTQHIFRTL